MRFLLEGSGRVNGDSFLDDFLVVVMILTTILVGHIAVALPAPRAI